LAVCVPCGIAEQSYPGLFKIETSHKPILVCMYCFCNELTSLSMCCVKIAKLLNNSNCKQHIEHRHKKLNDICYQDYAKVIANTEGTSGSNVIDSESSCSSSSVVRSGNSLYASKSEVEKSIIERATELQLQFMRSTNLPACHVNSPDLKAFIEHIIDNSAYFKKNRSKILMGQHKFRQERYRSFNKFIKYVQNSISISRNWYQRACGSRETIPFITVAHDGWDSNDCDMLGVCIHYVDAEAAKKRVVAVGLQQLCSKTSNNIALHVLKILERFGICQDDIFRSVNDTMALALKAGTLVAASQQAKNGGTTCHMHASELVLKHALGLTVWKKRWHHC